MASLVPDGFVPKAKYQHLVQKYNDLFGNYNVLLAKCDKYESEKSQLDAIRAKVAESNKRIHIWKSWIEHEKEKLLSVPQPPDDGDSRSTSIPPMDEVKVSSNGIPSSQTTEDEPISSSPAQAQPSSDPVEVVSARPVKRRRGNAQPSMYPPARVKQEPNSPDNPIEFGSGGFSSPNSPRKNPFMLTETSDLDALVSRVRTPRKRRAERAVSEDRPRRASMLPAVSSLSEGDDPKADGSNELAGQDAGLVNGERQNSALRPLDQAVENQPLRQLSANVPYGSETKANMKRKRGSTEDIRDKIAMLSEDGEMQPSQNVPARFEQPPQCDVRRRLASLLDGPTPERGPLPQRSTPQTVIRRIDKHIGLNVHRREDAASPIERILPPDKRSRVPEKIPPKPKVEDDSLISGRMYALPPGNTRIAQHKQQQKQTLGSPEQRTARFKRPRALEKSPRPPDPEEEPLRSRPLDSLHLDDFKINPTYLGSDFAFADTVRGRDQRRCLQGCTRPDCCGNAFRAAVEAGAINSTLADAEVLAEYLGPDWKQHYGAFTAEKRKEMLISARSFVVANKHGKHRQAYERARSPPGFWRTDMPSTQEEEEDRAKAREMERQKVEERWRDALRLGGRWLFRDEKPS